MARTNDSNPDEVNETLKLLIEIQKKIVGSPALNGGFDKLLLKIEQIEEKQEKTLQEIETIRNAIYDPNEGVFAAIKSSEAAQNQEFHQLEKRLQETKIFLDFAKQQLDEKQKVLSNLSNKVSSQESTIKELTDWKTSVSGAIRWIIMTLITGMGGLVYDILFHRK